MAPLGPLTSNRLTVRLDPERAAQLEFYAIQNPMSVRSYNQVLQEALDELLKRNVPVPGRRNLTISLPDRTAKKLYELQERGFGSLDELISGSISAHARTLMREESEYDTIVSKFSTVASRRRMLFSDSGREQP